MGGEPLSDTVYVPIKNARIILINDINGNIIKTGITDKNGTWKTKITVNRDLKFKDRKMGTITTIAVANGYNETIHFNVPVNELGEHFTSRERIILIPLNKNIEMNLHLRIQEFIDLQFLKC